MMVSRARSRTAHCFGVRFRVSSRTMWSWKHRDSKSIRTARGCHGSLAPTCQPIVPPSSSVSNAQRHFPGNTLHPPPHPSLRRTPHIHSTLSLERWLSSLAAVKISCVPWAERESVNSQGLQTRTGSMERGKGDRRRKWKGNVLTVWSVSGGRTIILSIVFITTRQSSFRTRFRTVFSHTVAKRVRLQAQATGKAGAGSESLRPRKAPVSLPLPCLSPQDSPTCGTHLPSRKSMRGRSTLSAS